MILITSKLKGKERLSCVWFLLIAMIISKVDKTAAHASSKSIYYGHQVTPREQFSVPFYTNSKHDYEQFPSCTQLRFIWKSALKELQAENPENYREILNEIPMIVNNPYYYKMVWHQQQPRNQPNYGKILMAPILNRQREHQNERQIRYNQEDESESKQRDDQTTQNNIPGLFGDTPASEDELGTVFGHVIKNPDEAQQHKHNIFEKDISRHEPKNKGVFGNFVEPAHETHDREELKNLVINKSNNNVKHQRTGESSFSSADEFFKSGLWHNKPVIPSVSFHA